MNTNIYRCDNHRMIEADTASQAASVFALRKARTQYGKTAQVGALRLDSYSSNGLVYNFDAFIGYPVGRNQTAGCNVRFTVYRE